jgi:hypothetical protein
VIGSRVSSGGAKLEVTFADAAGQTKVVSKTVRVPAH